ncbi:MAG: alpha/beta fold hydrolase [Myxococcota bacterium]
MAATRALTVLRLDDGRDLAFGEFGDPSGTPVIGFHGTPGSNLQIGFCDAAARAERVRLIAPDRPGYGHSSYDGNRRLVDWPRDVEALADALGLERFGVFGVSGGGPHAAVCAHALGPRLLGAAIVSGVAPPDTPGLHDGMIPVNRVNFALARQSQLFVLPIMAAMLFGLRHFPDQALNGMLRGMPEPDRRILSRREVADVLIGEGKHSSATAARAAAQDFALFARPWRFQLEDIAVPVHVWHGDVDVNVPVTHARWYADRIPNAKLHLCPGEGHLLFIERAAEILAAVSGHAPGGK